MTVWNNRWTTYYICLYVHTMFVCACVNKYLGRHICTSHKLMSWKILTYERTSYVHMYNNWIRVNVLKICNMKICIENMFLVFFFRNGLQLTELGVLKSDWETYDTKFRNLRLKIKEAELSSNNDCDNFCLTVSNDLSGLLKFFIHQ